MFQIGFGLESDNQHAIWYNDVIRSILAVFDKVIYNLIKYVYVIFFKIANTSVISSETVKDFYGRIQLILGVFMIFKLSVSLIQIVMNPDLMTDQKQGFGKIISRIIIMLAMFVAIMPLNIPSDQAAPNSYNAYLNEHGLLFGTMYSLQYRVLENNTIAKLILGEVSDNNNLSSNSKEEIITEDEVLKELKKQFPSVENEFLLKIWASATYDKMTETIHDKQEKSGDRLATYILKAFIRKNSSDICPEDQINDGEENIHEIWDKGNSVNSILNHITDTTCYTKYGGKKAKYALTYFPIVSTICGAIVLVCLLSFCIDIAIRSIKLAVLRLIAPIPIMSYIDPKSSEKGAFANWTQMLISTYLDLFLRLAIIYFIVYLVEQIIENGLVLPIANNVTSVLATVFIIIGLFIFARMAPKFIKDALGMKGNMSNIGLGSVLAGAGALATHGSIHDAWDAARNSTDTQIEAFNQGKQAPGVMSNFRSGRDFMAQNLTGNPKMTYAQMRRGLNHLAREGIDSNYADAEQAKMYKLKDDAARAKNLYDRYTEGNASEAELRAYARNNGLQFDATRQTFTDGKGKVIGVRKALEDNYLEIGAKAGRQEAKFKAIQSEQEKWGASQSFSEKYHSRRSNARLGDLRTSERRAAVFEGGFINGARNLASMPGNSIEALRESIAQRTAENTRTNAHEVEAQNGHIQDARNSNNP